MEMKLRTDSSKESIKGGSSQDEARRHGSREAMSNKYAAIREQQERQSVTNIKPLEKNIASTKVSLLDMVNSDTAKGGSSSGLSSTWESMKTNFQSFKANIGAKKFLPLRQNQETKLVSRVSSSDSLDEIFQRLKRQTPERGNHTDDDEDVRD